MLAASLLTPSALRAQGVPRLAFGLDAGSGPRTGRAGEVYYRDDRARSVRITGQLRLARFGPVAPVARLDGVLNGFGQHLDCPIAPNGSCREYGPENGGWGIGAGLAWSPVGFAEASLVAGRGRYGDTSRDFLSAQAALSPFRHVAVTASLTHMTWKERGYPHWFRPVHLGLRIQ